MPTRQPCQLVLPNKTNEGKPPPRAAPGHIKRAKRSARDPVCGHVRSCRGDGTTPGIAAWWRYCAVRYYLYPLLPARSKQGARLYLPWLHLPWLYLLWLGVPCSRSLWPCSYADHLVVEQGEAGGGLVALSRALGAREAGKGGERSRGHLASGEGGRGGRRAA